MSEPVQTLTMRGLVRYMTKMLAKEFGSDISQIYFGDPLIYPPKAFQDDRGNDKIAVAIVPLYNRKKPKSETAKSVIREYGLRIQLMLNLSKYFETLPSKAPGEEVLAILVEKIATFLEQQANVDLQHQVLFARVDDIYWDIIQRDKLAIRAAAIDYQVDVEIEKNM